MLEFSRTLYGKWSEMVDFLAFFLPRAKKERGKRRFFVDFPFFGNGENVKFSGKGGGGGGVRERERRRKGMLKSLLLVQSEGGDGGKGSKSEVTPHPCPYCHEATFGKEKEKKSFA